VARAAPDIATARARIAAFAALGILRKELIFLAGILSPFFIKPHQI
jgi:hypothetical protein